MGLGRRLSTVLLAAGSVLVAAGAAGASTDPEVERDGQDSTSTTTTSTTRYDDDRCDDDLSHDCRPCVYDLDDQPDRARASTAGDAEQLPTFYLRGLCVTARGAFIFAMSNLDTAPVQVELVFNGAALRHRGPRSRRGPRVPDGRARDDGRLDSPVRRSRRRVSTLHVRPNLEASAWAGCAGTSLPAYHWLLGNAEPDPVDVEVRLNGAAVGTFTVESRGFAGFTTPGASRRRSPRRRPGRGRGLELRRTLRAGPASMFGTCFVAWPGLSLVRQQRRRDDHHGGAPRRRRRPQAVLTFAPFEGQEVITAAGRTW